jgi:hypothetical protein
MFYLFDNLQTGLMTLCEIGIKNDPTNALGPMVVVETWQRECQDSNQEFLLMILTNLQKSLMSMYDKFVARCR